MGKKRKSAPTYRPGFYEGRTRENFESLYGVHYGLSAETCPLCDSENLFSVCDSGITFCLACKHKWSNLMLGHPNYDYLGGRCVRLCDTDPTTLVCRACGLDFNLNGKKQTEVKA